MDHKTIGRGRTKKTKFLVRWAGYGQEEDTWEFEEDIHKDVVAEYRRRIEQENRN